MAGRPSHHLSAPCVVSRSVRATCENSRQGSPTATTTVTSAIAKSSSRHSNIMRGRHEVVEPRPFGSWRRTPRVRSRRAAAEAARFSRFRRPCSASGFAAEEPVSARRAGPLPCSLCHHQPRRSGITARQSIRQTLSFAMAGSGTPSRPGLLSKPSTSSLHWQPRREFPAIRAFTPVFRRLLPGVTGLLGRLALPE